MNFSLVIILNVKHRTVTQDISVNVSIDGSLTLTAEGTFVSTWSGLILLGFDWRMVHVCALFNENTA